MISIVYAPSFIEQHKIKCRCSAHLHYDIHLRAVMAKSWHMLKCAWSSFLALDFLSATKSF